MGETTKEKTNKSVSIKLNISDLLRLGTIGMLILMSVLFMAQAKMSQELCIQACDGEPEFTLFSCKCHVPRINELLNGTNQTGITMKACEQYLDKLLAY